MASGPTSGDQGGPGTTGREGLFALAAVALVAIGCATGEGVAAPDGSAAPPDLAAPPDQAPAADLLGCGDGGLVCAGQCVDPGIDQRHCGACGRDCLGGACNLGTCGPNIIFQIDHPLAVATDGRYLYFTDDVAGSVSRHRLASGEGGPFEVLALNEDHPIAVAVDDTSAFWVNAGGAGAGAIRGRPLAGGDRVTLAGGLAGPAWLALDATHVYYTVSDEGAVYRVPKGGGASSLVADQLARPLRLALDATSAYVTCAGDGTIVRLPKAGGGRQTVASGEASPLGIAVDADRVCWGSRAAGTVRCAPLAGGAVTQPADHQAGPDGLLLVDGTLYFTNASDAGQGSLVKVAAQGAPVTLLAAPFTFDARGLTSDGVSLMLADHSTGLLLRIAR